MKKLRREEGTATCPTCGLELPTQSTFDDEGMTPEGVQKYLAKAAKMYRELMAKNCPGTREAHRELDESLEDD